MEGKDIALKDRIKLFFPNVTLCDEGCQIKGVNLTTFKAKCECLLNNLMENKYFGKNILFQSSLGEVESLIKKTNVEVLKCYKDIFVLKYFISNTGGFIIISLILAQIILAIIYYCKSLYSIRKYIFNITEKYIEYLESIRNKIFPYFNNAISNKNNKFIKYKEPPKKRTIIKNEMKNIENIKRNNKKGKTRIDKKKSTKNIIKRNSQQFNPYYKLKNFILENNNQNNLYISNSKHNNINSKDSERTNIKINIFPKNESKRKAKFDCNKVIDSNEELYRYKSSNPITNKNNNDLLICHIDGEEINIKEYLSTDPDDMDYDDAIKKDNRKFCQFFYDKLKANQMILNTFLKKDPLIPKTLKILLFILNIELYFFINGLFFNEDYISQMLNVSNDEGILPFIDRFFDRFIYLTIVGVIIGYIIECFFVDDKKLIGIFKREKDNITILKYEISQTIKNITRRYNSFIILSFAISILILYYVFCFNNTYPSMKGEWIKTSIIIIFSMQALSVLQCFLETCFRFISFKCKSEKIYKVSLLLS